MKTLIHAIFPGLILLTAGTSGAADTNTPPADIALEDLVNITVTSVGRKETPLETAPAAISVITAEDIRRSGLTSIPELLRMVPGLDVARIDANHWAVSARGFNGQYANKLLVLIDGRTVYAPISSGVYWNVQDTPLETIERIEVIRGPGATLWGANAVNGVINIITKSAKDTQGGFVSVTYGSRGDPSATVTYGGQIATNLFYRAYFGYLKQDNFVASNGRSAEDGWDALRGGFRLDWQPSEDNKFNLQGDYYYSRAGESVDLPSLTAPFANSTAFTDQNKGGNVLGRWTHEFSGTSELAVQSFYDHAQQGDAPVRVKLDTYDIDLQHRFAAGERHDIVWGAGFRYLLEEVSPSFFATLTPQRDGELLFTTFMQDDITLIRDRLHFIVGSKFEYNDSTGFEFEPGVRLAWTPTASQTVWAAVSRAVRTPADLEQDIRQNQSVVQPPTGPPVLVSLFGNKSLDSEELTAFELGYRIRPIERLSFDAATFYNIYRQLIYPVAGAAYLESSPAPAHIVMPLNFENGQSAETYGGELMAEWRPVDTWKLSAGYALLQTRFRPDMTGDESSPRSQFQIRSELNLPHHLELNGALYYVDQISVLAGNNAARVPAYYRLDIGLTWHPVKSLELGIFGQNLADNQHPEFGGVKAATTTEIPRSVMGRLTWRF